MKRFVLLVLLVLPTGASAQYYQGPPDDDPPLITIQIRLPRPRLQLLQAPPQIFEQRSGGLVAEQFSEVCLPGRLRARNGVSLSQGNGFAPSCYQCAVPLPGQFGAPSCYQPRFAGSFAAPSCYQPRFAGSFAPGYLTGRRPVQFDARLQLGRSSPYGFAGRP